MFALLKIYPSLQGVGPGISGLSGGIIYERMGMR